MWINFWLSFCKYQPCITRGTTVLLLAKNFESAHFKMFLLFFSYSQIARNKVLYTLTHTRKYMDLILALNTQKKKNKVMH